MSLRESESRVQFLVISVDFCQLRIKYHVIRASAETCYECLRGENKQKLEVLSFEKAWDKIEKDSYINLAPGRRNHQKKQLYSNV